MNFKFNEHNVCLNPEHLFKTEPHEMAWNYISISIANDGKNWVYGFSTAGHSSNCSKVGKSYKSKFDCIEDAVKTVHKRCLHVIKEGGDGLGVITMQPAKQYLQWYDSRGQLSLF